MMQHFGGSSAIYVQDLEQNTSWEGSFVRDFRLFQGLGYATFGLICLISSSKCPSIQSVVSSHSSALWILIGAFALFGTLFYELVLERQIGWSSLDQCDSKHITTLCPNVVWAVTAVSNRISKLYGVNFILGIPYRYTVILNMTFLICLLLTIVPFGPLRDAIWSSDDFQVSILMGLTQCIIHTFISIALGKEYEKERHEGFKNAREIQQYKESTRMVLATMIPERLVSRINVTPTVNAPKMLCEEFPMVTVLFCSFNRNDVARMSSAHQFLQIVSDTIAHFDRLVDEAGLCKVEHIGEDYVVASPIIKNGPRAALLEEVSDHKQTAVKLIEAALMLIDFGNASKGEDRSVTTESYTPSNASCGNPRLNFSAGVHSGPLIGAIAGRKRRFYRLFGDTVNTAARMCQHASKGVVQISGDTQTLIDGSHQFTLVEHTDMQIKGKGLMSTFVVVPDPQHVHFHDNIASCNDYRVRGSQSSQSMSSTYCKQFLQFSDMGMEKPANDGEAVAVPRFQRRCASGSSSIDDIPSVSSAMHTFGWQQEEEQMKALWSDEMKEVEKEIGSFSGKFLNKRVEKQFTEAVADSYHEHWKKQMLLTAFVHATFFPSMFAVIQYSEPLFEKSCTILNIIGVGTLLVTFHLVTWFRMYWWNQHCGSCSLVCSPAVSGIGMLAMLIFCRSPYGVLGITIAVVMRHSHESPQSYLVSSVFMLATSAAILPFILEEVTPSRVVATLAGLAGIIFVMTYFRIRHCQSLRSTWKLCIELNKQSEYLDRILDDLMPSFEARKFIQQRYLSMAQPLGHIFTVEESRSSVASMVFCIDKSSLACALRSDLVGFTPLCQGLRPWQVVQLLHELWCIADSCLDQFKRESTGAGTLFNSDHLTDVQNAWGDDDDDAKSHCSVKRTTGPFKMDTVGDAYIVISRLSDSSNATRVRTVSELVKLASVTMNAIHEFSLHQAPETLGLAPGLVKMRMGLALGDAVSGVVGFLQPRYHVFGDVLRQVALVEAESTPGCLKVGDNIKRMYKDLMQLDESCTFSLIKSLDCAHHYISLPLVPVHNETDDLEHDQLLPSSTFEYFL